MTDYINQLNMLKFDLSVLENQIFHLNRSNKEIEVLIKGFTFSIYLFVNLIYICTHIYNSRGRRRQWIYISSQWERGNV